MIAADDDRSLEFARRDNWVEGEPEPVAVAQAHPADPRRQTLELDSRTRHVEPIVQMRAVWHELFDLGVGPENVLGIAGQRGPPKGSDATAEKRSDVGRHEAW